MSDLHRTLSRVAQTASQTAAQTAPEATIPYHIRRSQRARRVRVTVDPARGVEVVLPRRAARHEAATAIVELRPWIERRLAELERATAAVAARGDAVPYLGTMLRLVPQGERTHVHRVGSELLVPDGAASKPAIERWYRRAARVEIAPRLDRACLLAGTSYSKLTIRSQRTRWASCSRSGAMSFNWRLLLAPEPVLDYVVWHEVCHLEIPNHSARFWRRLEECCPVYPEYARWLREHGATLVL
jgi:predicted metal-dependent hydrolase